MARARLRSFLAADDGKTGPQLLSGNCLGEKSLFQLCKKLFDHPKIFVDSGLLLESVCAKYFVDSS